MPATYDPTLPTAKDQVRLLIRDTDPANAHLQDTEIAWFVTQNDNVYFAAADAAENIAATYAGRADKTVGPLRIQYRDFQQRFTEMAASLRARARRRTGFKIKVTAPPRQKPLFEIGMHDDPTVSQTQSVNPAVAGDLQP